MASKNSYLRLAFHVFKENLMFMCFSMCYFLQITRTLQVRADIGFRNDVARMKAPSFQSPAPRTLWFGKLNCLMKNGWVGDGISSIDRHFG
jgi:hypothetical protein